MLPVCLKESLQRLLRVSTVERVGASNNNSYVLCGMLVIGRKVMADLFLASFCIDHSNATTETDKFNKLLQKLDELMKETSSPEKGYQLAKQRR